MRQLHAQLVHKCLVTGEIFLEDRVRFTVARKIRFQLAAHRGKGDARFALQIFAARQLCSQSSKLGT